MKQWLRDEDKYKDHCRHENKRIWTILCGIQRNRENHKKDNQSCRLNQNGIGQLPTQIHRTRQITIMIKIIEGQ